MAEKTLAEVKAEFAAAEKALKDKQGAIAAGQDLPQDPRPAPEVTDDLLHRLVEHAGSPPRLDVLLRELDAGKAPKVAAKPADAPTGLATLEGVVIR